MKWLKWLLGIVIILVILVVGFLAYLGYFSTPQVSEQKIGPLAFVYEPYVGEYKNTYLIFDKLNKALKADGIVAVAGIGIYYDDPKIVAADQLRSDIGLIIAEKDSGKIFALGKKYRFKRMGQRNSMVVEFPIRNIFSYMIGPSKAYPALTSYLQAKNYKMTNPFELYDMKNGKILYVMEIIK